MLRQAEHDNICHTELVEVLIDKNNSPPASKCCINCIENTTSFPPSRESLYFYNHKIPNQVGDDKLAPEKS